MRTFFLVTGLLVTLSSARAADLQVNALWDHAPLAALELDDRARLARLGQLLAGWTLDVAGVPINGAVLGELAAIDRDEPLERAVREVLHRPIKLQSLIYFLDDVVAFGARGQPVVVTPGRARKLGLFVSPAEVFDGEVLIYPNGRTTTPIHPPRRPRRLLPARDGAVLGPRWTARYPNPVGEERLLRDLLKVRPKSDFQQRVWMLIKQLRNAGADVWLSSTLRPQKRGYLIWGSYILSRSESADEFRKNVRLLVQRNEEWGLKVPIKWFDPKGWEVSRERAKLMAEAYDVVYATERGARESDHYTGVAVDMTIVGLPRYLVLKAPDGIKVEFDLSGIEETRDLSLSPALIDWVEEHFSFAKLRGDYPHWTDATAEEQDVID